MRCEVFWPACALSDSHDELECNCDTSERIEKISPRRGAMNAVQDIRAGAAMRQLLEELYWRNLRASVKGMGATSYALLAGMVAMLIVVAVMATLGWKSAAGTDVPPVGYAAMAAGILFSLVVGVGLMALVFYSSRAGYDEPAKLIVPKRDPPSE
jgi:hypothetical protein